MLDLATWLRLTKFRGMFFASVPALGDMGAGEGGDDGGAGGDDGGQGDDGGGIEEILPDGDTEVEEQPDGEEGHEEETDESDKGGEKSKRPLTPEQISKAVEKSLAKLREADPEGAKLVRKEFFKLRQEANGYKEAFPTAVEAQEARATLEELGGSEGITKMRTDVEDYGRELRQMADGDPQAIEDLARDFPDGLIALTPHALSKLEALNKPEYERLISAHMTRTMFEKGFTHSVDRMMELIADGKGEQALALAKNMREWIKGAEQFGKSAPATPAKDKKLSDVERREQAAAQKEQDIKTREISTSVTRTMNSILAKHINPLIKGKTLTLGQKQRLAVASYDAVANALKDNKVYQKNLRSLLTQGDPQKIARFVGSQVARIAQKSVRGVWDEFGGFGASKTGPKAGAARGSGAGGNARPKIGEKPSADQVDWSKDRNKMRFMSGEATLLPQFGGKVVKWDRDAL